MAQERVAWVAGGAGALGAALAEHLAARGWRGISTSRRASGAPAGWRALAASLDDEAGANAGAKACLEAWGRLDLAVCAAGAWEGGASATAADGDTFERMWRANAATAWHAGRAAARAMAQTGRGGAIVLIGAYAALARPAGGGQAAYRSAKAAVASLAETLAADFAGDRIAVFALAPSTLDTPQNRRAMPDADPQGWLSLEEVAAAVDFLAEPAAACLSGGVFGMDRRWPRPALP